MVSLWAKAPEPSDLLGRLQRCKKKGANHEEALRWSLHRAHFFGKRLELCRPVVDVDVEDSEKVASLVRRTPDRSTLMMARVVQISPSNRSLCSREARTDLLPAQCVTGGAGQDDWHIRLFLGDKWCARTHTCGARYFSRVVILRALVCRTVGCHSASWRVISRPVVLPCRVVSCRVQSRPVVSRSVMSCLVWWSPNGVRASFFWQSICESHEATADGLNQLPPCPAL